ncbi:MAG TPA: substrate-binding domain-containing protein [Solirubrobacteraceae bacterium]|nr:substrate-binding domain-containing protein [Solirubrobacteraceae bacterium]
MRRALTKLLTGLALAGLGAGCGVSINNAARQNQQKLPTPAQGAAQINPHPARLPGRPAGQVDVDGRTQGSLTQAVVAGGIRGVTVNLRNNGSQTAFDELCAGQIDAVDSSSPIPPTSWQTCARNGVKPIQFQVAADAVVVATKNESDMSVDCLTLGQIQELFRAGSPITSWNQFNNAFNIPASTAGPTPNTEAFGFFSRYVLLADPPTLTAFRSDYRQYATDDGVRFAVVGQAATQRSAALQPKAQHDLAALRSAITQKRRFIGAAQLQLQTDQRSGASANTIASAQNQLNTLKSQLPQLQASLPAAIRFTQQTGAAAAQLRQASGTAGIFRFSYYKLWEEQLRPIEVDANPGTTTPTSHNCIFPSQQTVTDATFPLARQLLITVTAAGLKRPEVRAFLNAYLAQAQSLATGARLVSLPDSTIAQEKGWVSNPSSAPVIVYTTAQIQAAQRPGALPAIPPSTALPAGPTSTGTTPTTTTGTGTTTTGTGTTSTPSSQTSAPTVGPQ